MSYQLRSRKDPASLDAQEQTDTSEGTLTGIQITTPSQTLVVPPQLSDVEQIALPMTEANPFQDTSSAARKPETVSTLLSDFEGPTRLDPGSAAAPAEAMPPADAVGPPSTVMSGRDAILTGNQPQQLYDTIDASTLSLIHDRQEVKHTNTTGTTLVSPPGICRKYYRRHTQHRDPQIPMDLHTRHSSPNFHTTEFDVRIL